MPEYNCNRCRNYTADRKTHMYNHLCKETKCLIHINCLNMSHDQHIKFSLINSSDMRKNNNVYYNENNINCEKTTIEFINELKNIYTTKRTKCNHCNVQFNKNKELEKHLFSCVRIVKDNNNTNINQTPVTTATNATNTPITNIHSASTTIINNNVNGNVNINNQSIIQNNIVIVPFDKDWITEHIDNETKMYLFLKKFNNRYTDTLDAIMENDINKNILIDKDFDSGIVYNNNNLERMKIKDIVNECVNKLQKHLVEFGTRIMDVEGVNEHIIKSILKDNRFELYNYKSHTKNDFDFNNVLVDSLNKVHEETKTQMLKYENQNNKIMN